MKIIFTLILVALLIAIRAFENLWFYDPFILHFKGENYFSNVPDYQLLKLIISTVLRYMLNSFISLLILKIWFTKPLALRFWVFFYLTTGLVLLILFMIILLQLPDFYEAFFYARRFLIQPLWLLILFPAMAYERLQRQKK